MVADEDELLESVEFYNNVTICHTVARIIIQSSDLHTFVSRPREYIRMSVDVVPIANEKATTPRNWPERSSPAIL